MGEAGDDKQGRSRLGALEHGGANLTGANLEWSATVDSNGSPNGSAELSSGTGTTQTLKLYIGSGVSLATFTVTLTAIDTDDNAQRASDMAILTVRQLI